MAHEVTSLTASLRHGLRQITVNSVSHMEIFHQSHLDVTERVATAAVSMRALIEKCHSLNSDFDRVKLLHLRIQELKGLTLKLFEMVEKICKKKPALR